MSSGERRHKKKFKIAEISLTIWTTIHTKHGLVWPFGHGWHRQLSLMPEWHDRAVILAFWGEDGVDKEEKIAEFVLVSPQLSTPVANHRVSSARHINKYPLDRSIRDRGELIANSTWLWISLCAFIVHLSTYLSVTLYDFCSLEDLLLTGTNSYDLFVHSEKKNIIFVARAIFLQYCLITPTRYRNNFCQKFRQFKK